MYSIVLAMALTPGSAAPAADISDELRELRRSIAVLREEQNESRADELKLVIAGLRQRITDEKLDELRRDILNLRHEEHMFHARAMIQHEEHMFHVRAMMMHEPVLERSANRATIAVELPVGATFVVNNMEVAVPAMNPIFVSPPLEPGKDYFYDCKVTVKQDGKNVTKTKRVKVRAGELIRINYEEMEAR
ncbi:MAG: TIGR03000 domain-containing protein [Gemmataceae bacterium]